MNSLPRPVFEKATRGKAVWGAGRDEFSTNVARNVFKEMGHCALTIGREALGGKTQRGTSRPRK